jgi:probable ATP-binding/permease fusion ABC transporter
VPPNKEIPSDGSSSIERIKVRLFGHYLHDFEIAVESIRGNKLKSFLTALGIIFGVAAVISMLAIGSGAQREILEQMKQVGVNNIVINAVEVVQENNLDEGNSRNKVRKYSPGLSLRDLKSIKAILPSLRYVVPMVQYQGILQTSRRRLQGEVVGITNDYFALYNIAPAFGCTFSPLQEDEGAQICVIGKEVRSRLFGQISPLGKSLKFAGLWFKVVGILDDAPISGTDTGLGPVNSSSAIFVPIQTLVRRYKSRATRVDLQMDEEERSTTQQAQLDRLLLQVSETRLLEPTAEVLNRMLARLHSNVEDYKVVIPEQLLKQQQRTSSIFNWVLGAIAGISLLVGGIGIMNIMFASVMERIKEIGTRLAIGAKRADIVAQFLLEAILISVSGGFFGIVLGIGLSLLITQFAGIETIVSWYSVFVSFGVSVTVGLIFGMAPARRAAQRNPIESLRYE